MPSVPWHRLVTCSHLLSRGGGLFARLFVVLSPSWTPEFPFFGCFPCPRFVFGVLFGSSRAVAPLCCVLSCWCFCLRFCGCLLFGLCVPPAVWWGFLVVVLLLGCGGLPSPACCCLPPPFGWSLAASWPVSVLVPPSGYLVASCDGPVALP